MFVLNSVAKCKLPTEKQFISFNVETFTVCVSGKFVHWTYGLIKYKQKSDVYSSKCHKLLRNNIKCIFKMNCTWNAIALFYLNIQLIWFLSNWFGLCKYRVTNLLQLHFELRAHKRKNKRNNTVVSAHCLGVWTCHNPNWSDLVDSMKGTFSMT